jgi:hypothetical protein
MSDPLTRPPNGGGEDTAAADPEPPSSNPPKLTLRRLKNSATWTAIFEIARDYLFGYLLLHHGFPGSNLLNFQANESFNEAVYRYNYSHGDPNSRLSFDLGKQGLPNTHRWPLTLAYSLRLPRADRCYCKCLFSTIFHR